MNPLPPLQLHRWVHKSGKIAIKKSKGRFQEKQTNK